MSEAGKIEQSALTGVTARDINIGTISQTINYQQILQEAQRTGILVNLPPTNVAFFAGWQADLDQVHQLLQANQRVAVSAFVKGMGGVGKSELAIQYGLRHLLADYRGGVCWLRANEGTLPTQLQNFVEVQLRQKMPEGYSEAEVTQYCWQQLADRPESSMLVVLDDVKNYDDVQPFLPPLNGRFRVLVTTRLGLGSAMQQYTLDLLRLPDAVDLLQSFLPETDPRRADTAKIAALCEWLGRLPLAVELVGRYLARKPDLTLTELQGRLETKKLHQEALSDTQRRALPEMTAKLNVAAAFDLSWQELSETAQRLACLLSLFALAPIPWEWVTDAMKDVDAETLEACRDDELLNLHLLEREGQELYQLHQLLREYFQFQLEQQPHQSQILSAFYALFADVAESVELSTTLALFNFGSGATLVDGVVSVELSTTLALFKRLEPHLKHAVDLQNDQEDLQLARCLNGLALLNQSQGKYSEAEPLYVRSLEIRQRHLGADHPNVANSLNNLALLYQLQGKYIEAEPLYVRSLEIRQRHLGADHIEVATSLNNLACLYQLQGKYSEAEPLFRRSLEIRERQLGVDHPDVANSLNNLALLYHLQGKYSEAEPLYVRSLEIRQRHLGADHIEAATSLNNLAYLYYLQGKYSKAEPLFGQSLEIWERQLGTDHPDVATSLNNLALLYRAQERYSEAEPLFRRSLEIRQRQLGADHPDIATSLNNLAALYQSQGKYSEAESLFRRSLEIRERQLGADHPDIATSLNNLAGLYRSQGKYSEAEPLYLQAIKIDTGVYGKNHLEVAIDSSNLAQLYSLQKRYIEAESLFQQMIPILEQALGCEHPRTIKVRENYALLREVMAGEFA